MNHLTLRHRLLILTLLPSLLIGIALVIYFTVSGIRSLESELHAKGLSTARYLAPVSEYGIITGQFENLHTLALATNQEPSVKATVIVNQRGRALAVSGRVSMSSETLRQKLDKPGLVAETESWLAYGAPVFRSVSESDSLFDPMLPSDKPLAQEVIGQVFVELDKNILITRQHDLLIRGLMIVLVGMIILATLAIAVADNLSRPVMRLVNAVRAMSEGKLSTRVPPVSTGELGILEQGFNEMAKNLDDIHQSLQTRIEEATAQLAFQARHDALTGLLNRREFEIQLEKALAAVQAGADQCSVLFIDLDRFKPVNDNCGHLAGDEVLRQISQLFQGRLRDEDTLARLGGDEFGVLLHNCVGPRARQVAEDLCGLAGAYRFIWQDKVFAIGASIGLTQVTREVRNINELLAAGDAACYRAKESGRNQVCEQTAHAPTERRRETGEWVTRIGSALTENRLVIEAIPVRARPESVLDGPLVELTAHLVEPGQPSVSLSALLDAAERYELGSSIDLRFIDVAIAALARAHASGKQIHCLVPLTGSALGRSELITEIARRLAAENISGRGLYLMFSEAASTHNSSRAIEFARQLRTLGCQIALSDFGSGLSSFSHLRSLTPSLVKLSRSLTRDVAGSRASTSLLRAIQEIAADLDILSIAEGIDDPAMLGLLDQLRIDFSEGRAIGPREPFDAWLEGVALRAG